MLGPLEHCWPGVRSDLEYSNYELSDNDQQDDEELSPQRQQRQEHEQERLLLADTTTRGSDRVQLGADRDRVTCHYYASQLQALIFNQLRQMLTVTVTVTVSLATTTPASYKLSSSTNCDRC